MHTFSWVSNSSSHSTWCTILSQSPPINNLKSEIIYEIKLSRLIIITNQLRAIISKYAMSFTNIKKILCIFIGSNWHLNVRFHLNHGMQAINGTIVKAFLL
jgi:hypothetical protein